jgi:hypothetical protein
MCCQYVRKGETAKPGQMTKHWVIPRSSLLPFQNE